MKKEEAEWNEFMKELMTPKLLNVEDFRCGDCRFCVSHKNDKGEFSSFECRRNAPNLTAPSFPRSKNNPNETIGCGKFQRRSK